MIFSFFVDFCKFMISLAFVQMVVAKTGWQSIAAIVAPTKAAYSALPGLFLWRCVLVRSCFFTRDTSCDTKKWEGGVPEMAAPLGLPNSPTTQNTTLERMVFCVMKFGWASLDMLSISHSDLRRKRKSVPMLWRENASVNLS